MKILYSAGNRVGAGEQCKRILQHFTAEYKTAGFSSAIGPLTNLDWTLDFFYSELHSLPGIENLKSGKLTKELGQLLEEIKAFAPDLIISDGEPIISSLGHFLHVPLWYCSPLHLLDCVHFTQKDFFYRSFLNQGRTDMKNWPKAARTFIYSPFANLSCLQTKKAEWILPYTEPLKKELFFVQRKKILHKIFKASMFKEYMLSKWAFTTGDTNQVADILAANIPFAIAPNLKDQEAIVNGSIIRMANIGYEMGQFEITDEAVDELETAMLHDKKPNVELSGLYFHEIIKKG